MDLIHTMQYIELQHILDSYNSTLLGKYPHRYITFDLTSKHNAPLAEMLLTDGYWNWAPNRSSRLVSYHQIVAYYCTRHPATGGDLVEVHHINGKTTDNRPENLMYLTPADHALVTKYQRRLAKLSLKTFAKVEKGMARTAFNRRGKAIQNWARFMLTAIALTVSKTQAWVQTFCDNATHIAMTPIKGVLANLQRILKALHSPPHTPYTSPT
ncbi:hypothetical protein [Microcoleus phage My-WqHQDG]|nr:hypothetical protein [Microcoleus phage My-WqHQDG]